MNWNVVLLITATVMFLLLALIGGQVFSDTAAKPETTWAMLGFGLACLAAAHISYPRAP